MDNFDQFRGIASIQKYGEQQSHYSFSIVIPTYNKPASLKRAVQSALDQLNYSISYNILIVENYEGNVDETVEILSQLDNPNNIPVIYYQNEKNIGMFPNWNRCFELADADYVMMVHTDDYLLPLCVRYIEEAIKRNISALYLNRISLSVNNAKTKQKVDEETNLQKKTQVIISTCYHKESYMDILLAIVPVAPTGLMIKKDIFMKSGGFNNKDRNWPTDLEMAIHLVNSDVLYYCDKPLIVKTEGDGNWGNNIDSVIQLMFAVKQVFQNSPCNHYIPFKKQLINMRLAKMSGWYRIDYHPHLEKLFPIICLNRIIKGIYNGWCAWNRHALLKR